MSGYTKDREPQARVYPDRLYPAIMLSAIYVRLGCCTFDNYTYVFFATFHLPFEPAVSLAIHFRTRKPLTRKDAISIYVFCISISEPVVSNRNIGESELSEFTILKIQCENAMLQCVQSTYILDR